MELPEILAGVGNSAVGKPVSGKSARPRMRLLRRPSRAGVRYCGQRSCDRAKLVLSMARICVLHHSVRGQVVTATEASSGRLGTNSPPAAARSLYHRLRGCAMPDAPRSPGAHSRLCIAITMASQKIGSPPNRWVIPLTEWAALLSEYAGDRMSPNWGPMVDGKPTLRVLDTMVIPGLSP